MFFMILMFPTFAYAAQVYGNLKEGDRSVQQGVKVEIICGNQTYKGETDRYGSYSVYVPRGKCTLRVNYPVNSNQWPQSDIYSYNDPVRYDFDLVRQPDGTYFLRRR